MRIIKTQKSATSPLQFFLAVILLFSFSLQYGNAQSSNVKPNIASDEFTAKSAASGWKVGSTVPNVTFNDVNNKKAELYKLLEKPVILEFWTLDCAKCKDNKRYLKAFYKQFNINIVGISTDQYLQQIREYSEALDLHWMNVYDDSKKFVGKTFVEANNLGNPTFILITPDKKVHKVFYKLDDVKLLGVELQKYFTQ